MNIYDFLSNSMKPRIYDKVFIRWFQKEYGASNVLKEKEEWEKIYSEFMGEKKDERKTQPKKVSNVSVEKSEKGDK